MESFLVTYSGKNCYCQTPVLGLGLGVDFTFAWDNHNNHNDKNDNNPHINFVKGTVLGDKEQGVGIRDKWSLTLKTKSCLILFQIDV